MYHQCRSNNERTSSVERFRNEFDGLDLGKSAVVAGFATSMKELLPRDVPYELTVAELIDRSSIPDANSWESELDVRGFPPR